MKFVNGIFAGMVLMSMFLAWSTIGKFMLICAICYVMGYMAANEFFMGKDDEHETRTND